MEISEIESAIEEALDVLHIEIQDPRQDGKHFEALVVSSAFLGKSRVEQHQLVMEPLKDLFEKTLHALSLKTLTPEEWKRSET